MLTEQKKIWARAYVSNNFNGRKASEEAGYCETSYDQRAWDNSHSAEVLAYVAKLIAWRNERLDIDMDYVLKRCHDIDQLDFGDILDEDNNFLPIKEWPKVWRQTISTVELGQLIRSKNDPEKMVQILSKIKLPDKLKNLELLGKHTLVRAWDPNAHYSGNTETPPLNITFEVAEAKADVRVTNAPTA